MLIAVLGGIFLKGFKEAIGLAVLLVMPVICCSISLLWLSGFTIVVIQPDPDSPPGKIRCCHAQPSTAIRFDHWLVIYIAFPKLALGLSGFETGVAVMPLVKGDPSDDFKNPWVEFQYAQAVIVRGVDHEFHPDSPAAWSPRC